MTNRIGHRGSCECDSKRQREDERGAGENEPSRIASTPWYVANHAQGNPKEKTRRKRPAPGARGHIDIGHAHDNADKRFGVNA